MSATCEDCGADSGTVGVVRIAGKQRLCQKCVKREGVAGEVKPTPVPDINDLPKNAVCGNCGRTRDSHSPRSDWSCPGEGSYFNTPSPLVRRIAHAVGYTGLSEHMWFSDLDGLVEYASRLATTVKESQKEGKAR